jgi:hypothetical protein
MWMDDVLRIETSPLYSKRASQGLTHTCLWRRWLRRLQSLTSVESLRASARPSPLVLVWAKACLTLVESLRQKVVWECPRLFPLVLVWPKTWPTWVEPVRQKVGWDWARPSPLVLVWATPYLTLVESLRQILGSEGPQPSPLVLVWAKTWPTWLESLKQGEGCFRPSFLAQTSFLPFGVVVNPSILHRRELIEVTGELIEVTRENCQKQHVQFSRAIFFIFILFSPRFGTYFLCSCRSYKRLTICKHEISSNHGDATTMRYVTGTPLRTRGQIRVSKMTDQVRQKKE